MSAVNEVIRILSVETGDYVNERNVVTVLQDMIDAGRPDEIDDGQGRGGANESAQEIGIYETCSSYEIDDIAEKVRIALIHHRASVVSKRNKERNKAKRKARKSRKAKKTQKVLSNRPNLDRAYIVGMMTNY